MRSLGFSGLFLAIICALLWYYHSETSRTDHIPIRDSVRIINDRSDIKVENLESAIAFLKVNKSRQVFLEVTFNVDRHFCEEVEDPAIFLGRIYDFDQVFLNGSYIGSTGSRTSKMTRSFIQERMYRVNKEIINCDGANSLRIEVQKHIPGRIGPTETEFRLGDFEKLKRYAEWLYWIRATGPTHVGLTLIFLSPLFFFMFFGDRRWKYYLRFSFFLIISGFLSLLLCSAINDLALTPLMLFKINNIVVTWYIIAFSDFMFFYASRNSSPFLKPTLIAGAGATLFFIVAQDAVFIHKVYAVLLGIYLVLIVSVFILSVYLAEKRKNDNLIQLICIFLILSGNVLDISRYWELHSFPNISPWVLFVGLLVFGVDFVKELRSIVHNAQQEERYRAIAMTTQALAHDVRRPFSLLKIVMDTIDMIDNELELRDFMKGASLNINEAVAKVDGMIQDVMQIGMTAVPILSDCEPRLLIHTAIDELMRIRRDSLVEFTYEFAHVHKVRADQTRVGRVFSNIIENGIQATDPDGKIWIKTSNAGDFVQFVVGNSGSFISDKNVGHIFDAFYTSGKPGGTGLGLAVSKKIIEDHGGVIFCRSVKNEEFPAGYTEFVLTLPTSIVPSV
jgi:signal transduction histidine kinase